MPNGFFSPSSQVEQVPRFSPQQQQSQQQALAQSGQLLQQLQQPFDISGLEEQARRGFEQRTIPTLLERLGSSLGQGTSGATERFLTGQAGADLESQLAALRAQTGLQQRGQQSQLAQSLLGLGLQPQFESIKVEQPGFLQTVAPLLGQAIGGYFGGSSLGNILSLLSLFGGKKQQQQPQPQATPQDFSF